MRRFLQNFIFLRKGGTGLGFVRRSCLSRAGRYWRRLGCIRSMFWGRRERWEGGDHGAGGEGEGPEEDSGNTEDPEGEAGEDALYGGDGEAAERGCENGVADSGEELGTLVFVEGEDRAKGGEGECAVAEEEEEQEEHNDELGDDAERVGQDSGEVSSDVSSGAAGDVVDVDRGGEVFDARGESGTVGDEAGDLFLMGAVAECVDGAERLFADLLSEEEHGNDDSEEDEEEGDGGAEGAVLEF